MPSAKKPAPASITIPPAVSNATGAAVAVKKPVVKKAAVKKPATKKPAVKAVAAKPAAKKPSMKKAKPAAQHPLAAILEGFKQGGAKRGARIDGNVTDAQKEVLKAEAKKLGVSVSTLNAAIIVAWLAAQK